MSIIGTGEAHVTGIVGSIFQRLGRAAQDQSSVAEPIVLEGRIRHVEIARRNFALNQDGRDCCVGWDDGTKFVGTSASQMDGIEVVICAHANIVGLHAESITAIGDVTDLRNGHSIVTPRADLR